MSIKIKAIRDAGNYLKERLVLKVLRRDDIGSYAVFLTTSYDGSVTGERVLAYWFPDKNIKAGDLVVLYTKQGNNQYKKYPSGSTTHFFYWGLEESIWNDPDDTAVLVQIEEWESKEVSEDIMTEEYEDET